jgi:hypothetical protein
MKKVKVEDAIGMVVAHDLTKIVPGKFKGAAFKKGHVIEAKDIEELKAIGKNHIYIIEMNSNMLHEDEAALELGQAIQGENTYFKSPNEGKVNILAAKDGLLKINTNLLYEINDIRNIVVSTLHNNTIVTKDTIVSATKITPLVVEKKYINEAKNLLKDVQGIIEIKPFAVQRVGIVITGTEIYEGVIADKFAPIIEEKVSNYKAIVEDVIFVPDELEKINNAIGIFKSKGCNLIICSGGMSVDADDLTPVAIEESSSEVITYGSPVIPGAMFMLAYGDDITLVGIPACGMFCKITVFDILLPRIMANDKISKREISELSHGGLCLKCNICHYPICPFGK